MLLSLKVTLEDPAAEIKDGRQARSMRTRAAVAEAMLDCLEEGVLRPSAKQVAERAGVSTRAVFRHFDHMEGLFEAAAELQIERVMARLPAVVEEGPLDERIDSLVAHAAQLNEVIAPVRRAALLSEPFSEVIRERHAWMRASVRKQVRTSFAAELAGLSDAERSERIVGLAALLSFGHWEELRRHGRLSRPAASRVMHAAVAGLVGAQPISD